MSYPLNMRSMPAGGVNHGSSLQNIPYRSWKGTGPFSNPVGTTATNIRPLTNKDPGNIFPTGFGLPRPIKHFRKGTAIRTLIEDAIENQIETDLINYNLNRAVKSSTGSYMISQLNDMPGSVTYKNNDALSDGKPNETCKTCVGIGAVSSWQPIASLTETPEPNVTNPILCCNQQRKAIRRVLPASTNLKKNYFQTQYMYLYNRCQTFQQREFNFIRGPIDETVYNLFMSYPFVTAKLIEYAKPGSPLAIYNQYVAQCNPNFVIEKGEEITFIVSLTNTLLFYNIITEPDYQILIQITDIQMFFDELKLIVSEEEYKKITDYFYNIAFETKNCAKVYYKPNNYQYAKQGAVSSSTRILKLNVDTITTNAYRQTVYPTANELDKGNNPNVPFILKGKVQVGCSPQTYFGNPFFFQGQVPKKNICSKNLGDIY